MRNAGRNQTWFWPRRERHSICVEGIAAQGRHHEAEFPAVPVGNALTQVGQQNFASTIFKSLAVHCTPIMIQIAGLGLLE